jgi:hypothetical protein
MKSTFVGDENMQVLIQVFLDEINILRALSSLPPKTLNDFAAAAQAKLDA